MGKNYRETLAEELRNPEFRAIWEDIQPEWQIMLAIAEGMNANNMTEAQLSEATGIAKPYISRLENGTGNPSLRTLKRLAAGLGMSLKLEFVPLPPASR